MPAPRLGRDSAAKDQRSKINQGKKEIPAPAFWTTKPVSSRIEMVIDQRQQRLVHLHTNSIVVVDYFASFVIMLIRTHYFRNYANSHSGQI